MHTKVRTTLIGAAVALTAATGVAGASGASGTDASATGTADRLLVKLDEFKLTPSSAKARGGKVRIKAKNVGEGEHELVVAKTRRKPGKLPRTKKGDVKEKALNVRGEVSETPPGKSGKVTLDLKPGKYVMFCNVSGHYAQGMYGKLTVK